MPLWGGAEDHGDAPAVPAVRDRLDADGTAGRVKRRLSGTPVNPFRCDPNQLLLRAVVLLAGCRSGGYHDEWVTVDDDEFL